MQRGKNGTLKYAVLDTIYAYSLEGATKTKQPDLLFPYEVIYPTTLIHYLLLFKFAENKCVVWCFANTFAFLCY